MAAKAQLFSACHGNLKIKDTKRGIFSIFILGRDEWAEMAEIQKKQNPTSVDRSRPRGHLGCKGGCLEYKRELLGARKWPGSGDA